MKNLIKKIMSHSSLINRPPVLLDIGASGRLFSEWELIASYSICVAFDADTRDFSVIESENKGWKKLFSLNRLVTDKTADKMEFYLTSSPHCSSSLPPNNEAIKQWAFSRLFDVEKIVQLPAIDLQSALSQIGIDYIDWYKTDSQGTDLRIYDSLHEIVKDNILTAEFEPGIIDAYLGEDKLHHLMAYMDNQPFWVSSMKIKGSQRINQIEMSSLNFLQKGSLGSFLKTSPGWCEITYINSLKSDNFSCREYLLAWAFSSIKGEWGFALEVARAGELKFQEPLFRELRQFSLKSSSSTSGYIIAAAKAAKKIILILIGRKL